MALPPWAVSAIRRGLVDVARRAGDAETIAKLKNQATEMLRDLPEGAAKSLDSFVQSAVQSAKSGKDAIQRWVQRETEIAVPLINASGELLGSQCGTGCPVDDHVLQIGIDLLRGDCDQRGRRERIAMRLGELADGISIAVTSSLDAAVMALALAADSQSVVMHRSHAIRLPSGTPLPDALGGELLGCEISEVGGVQGIDDRDFDETKESLVVLADSGRAVLELPTFADSSNRVAVVLPVATFSPLFDEVPSAVEMISAGASLIVLPGDGLSGGPECGLVVGKTETIESLIRKKSFLGLAASDAAAAMMLTALEMSRDEKCLPISGLMEASEDNLRSRAERMATRLTGDENVSSCQITDEPARLTRDGRWRFPSRQLRLRHESKSASEWKTELAEGESAIATQVEGEDLIVDLRWVRASEDNALAGRIES